MQALAKINLVLDLDDVLINYPQTSMTEVHIFFEPYTLILSDNFGYYYICPAYIVEFMRYVNDRFAVSFFSAGDKQRNEYIVEKLWEKVFNCTKPDHVIVLSKPDLTTINVKNPPKMAWTGRTDHTYKSWYSNVKKDLTKIGPLTNTVIIDDNCGYASDIQIQNFLETNSFTFAALHNYYTHYFKYFIEGYHSDRKREYIAFYKLLHAVGVLEIALVHKNGVVDGLAEIYFINNESKHYIVTTDTDFHKKGYDILSKYITHESPPKFELLENLILQ